MIDPTAVPRHRERIAARVIDGKALIVILDEKQLHTHNSVRTRVWELCDGRSVEAIAGALVAEFEVEAGAALADVRRFVAELCERGALELGESA